MTFHHQRNHLRCACGSVLSSHARFAETRRFVLHGTERVYERPRPFRVEHVVLDLDLDHGKGAVDGTAVLRLQRVDPEATEVRFDAVGFELKKVERRTGRKTWTKASHVYDGETLSVEIPAEAKAQEVRVTYHANPRRGMYFLSPDEAVPDRPEQIWTQCQDEDARHIFPCHDKPHNKQTFETTFRVQPGWFVLSNGDPTGSQAKRKKGIFSFSMKDPMPSYLFTCVAGAFSEIKGEVGDLPVNYYVPKGREADGERSFRNTPAMIELFSKLTGTDYPWTKYHQIVVHDFIFGGMENTGATTMYEHLLLDERAAIDVSSDDLIAHELAHQWFGDLVTCRDWSHGWLNEGFATFFEHVWRQHDRGEDEYLYGLRGDLDLYLSEARGRYQRAVVCQDYEQPIDIFDRHLYEKGGLFLHTLRQRLGDERFWAGVKTYLERHRHGVVETRDLLRALEDTSGQSLERAFQDAVHRAAYPDVKVELAHEDDLLLVTVEQRQGKAEDTPFAIELELDVTVGRKTERWSRVVDRRKQTLAFPVRSRPRMVAVDSRLRILGAVEVKAPADMLRHQLLKAESGYVQAQAANALGRRDDPATLKALAKVLMDVDRFWGARATAAASLGKIRSEVAFKHLVRATAVEHPKVRRAVASALGQFKTEGAAKHLEGLARDDESLLVCAAASRALGATRQDVREQLEELLDRESWADTLRAGAMGGLAALRDEKAVEAVKKNTAYGVPNRGRRAAISALARLSSSRKVREHLEGLLDDPDPHVRTTVVVALSQLGDVRARGALSRQLERELDGRVRRRIREVLRDLAGRGRRDIKRLQEQLEEMGRNQADLKARLAKLEAKKV